MRYPPWFRRLAWTWVVLGLLFGALGMWAAWGENANEEIYDYATGEITWAEWLPIGLGGFLVAGLIPLAMTTVVVGVVRWFSRRGSSESADGAAR